MSERHVGGCVQGKEVVVAPSCSTGHVEGGRRSSASWIWGLCPMGSGERGPAVERGVAARRSSGRRGRGRCLWRVRVRAGLMLGQGRDWR